MEILKAGAKTSKKQKTESAPPLNLVGKNGKPPKKDKNFLSTNFQQTSNYDANVDINTSYYAN